ncbi:hypothetical protein ABJY94_18950 [Vibrio parahaemolyticus]|uniref:hypothetical protein n=1 Tax=Vibrio parahaemolyticus TaxID=670 RepID=UPI0032AF87B7
MARFTLTIIPRDMMQIDILVFSSSRRANQARKKYLREALKSEGTTLNKSLKNGKEIWEVKRRKGKSDELETLLKINLRKTRLPVAKKCYKLVT